MSNIMTVELGHVDGKADPQLNSHPGEQNKSLGHTSPKGTHLKTHQQTQKAICLLHGSGVCMVRMLG